MNIIKLLIGSAVLALFIGISNAEYAEEMTREQKITQGSE